MAINRATLKGQLEMYMSSGGERRPLETHCFNHCVKLYYVPLGGGVDPLKALFWINTVLAPNAVRNKTVRNMSGTLSGTLSRTGSGTVSMAFPGALVVYLFFFVLGV